MALETRHAIYTAVLASLDLRKEGVADLYRRGLTDEDIEFVRYRSLPFAEAKRRFLAELVDRFGEASLRACPGSRTSKVARTSG